MRRSVRSNKEYRAVGYFAPLFGRLPVTANARKPPVAKATAAPTRRSAVPCIASHSRIARARSGPKSVAASPCMHITAPNTRRVFGAREAAAHRITTSPMAMRTAPAAYSPTGAAKYSRRTVVTLSGTTRPTIPTTMVKRATSNAADLTSSQAAFLDCIRVATQPARGPTPGSCNETAWRAPWEAS